MSIKKFSEFAMNEDIVPLGFAISSKPSYYTLASSGIRTGYDMQPVVGPISELASNLSDQAIDYEKNENPDHTARGYINEALKYVKEKCYETYESKCNESLDENVTVSTDRYKRSHGKNPKGWGQWAFYFDSRGGEPIFTPSGMDYKDAVKWAKEKAKEANKSSIYVGEDLDVNENVAFIDKNDNDARIAIIDKKQYVVLTQLDFEKQNVNFYVNKDQIDQLCKILQKMK
jgi:hypothetical protein